VYCFGPDCRFMRCLAWSSLNRREGEGRTNDVSFYNIYSRPLRSFDAPEKRLARYEIGEGAAGE